MRADATIKYSAIESIRLHIECFESGQIHRDRPF